MRSLKLGLAATAMICALSATAQAADCVRVAVAGKSLTHDLAVLFSTNGLKNIMAGQGRVGQGPVQHDLQNRLRYDDVSLLADGVQSDNSQSLLGRLALPRPFDPAAWRQRRIARPWKSASIRFGNASSNESEEDSPAMKFIALGLTGFDPDRAWRRRRDQRCGRHRVMRQTRRGACDGRFASECRRLDWVQRFAPRWRLTIRADLSTWQVVREQ